MLYLQHMNIRKELEKQGLSPSQIKVYLATLSLGRATTIDIAKNTGIKRTTSYDVLMGLIGLGYISEAKKGKRRLFIAEDPSRLVSHIEQKLFDMKELAPLLKNIYFQSVPKPQIRFYDGIKGVQSIFDELLLLKSKEQLFWSSVNDMVEVLGKRYLDSWIKRRIKKGIWSKVLISKQTRSLDPLFEARESSLRQIHWLPREFVFNGVCCVYDNKVAYISTYKESFGFVIESEAYASMMRMIWKSMWAITSESK